ncbi:RidA family protein [Flavobacteriaceae bacterium]|jgi:enamine deaminase RidA (YjgF/YER057c/UK114 family)|nr:RidA family protein [Flavobacteriaceae bacterium]MDA8900673.1 RidA family protein [Flavobacteriaceae bacterium]MDB4306860.1 RidA family protein [Flavobacteriaceae bacterium]
MSTTLKERIKALGLVLPPAPPPAGVYKPILIVENHLYVSGQGPVQNDGSLIQGKVGTVLNKDQAKNAARQVGLTMLSSMVTHAPDNIKIKRVIKVLGMVNATPYFGDHPYVINGFSELMADVFGEENGIGVRSAVGMHLPQNIAVEIEALFLLET